MDFIQKVRNYDCDLFVSMSFNQIFKKEIINEVGYFRLDLKQILDYEFCYRTLKKYNIATYDNGIIK